MLLMQAREALPVASICLHPAPARSTGGTLAQPSANAPLADAGTPATQKERHGVRAEDMRGLNLREDHALVYFNGKLARKRADDVEDRLRGRGRAEKPCQALKSFFV
jgi:hypothetical protein